MGKRTEKEQLAIELYTTMEIPQIAVELGVSENSLRAWKKRAGTEWDDARAAARKAMLGSMEDVGTRLRRSREMAAALSGKAGLQGQSDMGQVVNELLRSLLWDISTKVQTDGYFDAETMAGTIDQLKGLALTIQRLEAAANLSVKREQEIRKQVLDEVDKKVDEATGGARKAITPEDFKRIIRESYGV